MAKKHLIQRRIEKTEKDPEIPKQYSEGDSGWLKRNTYLRKTSCVFALQAQITEIRAWKKIRGLVKCDKCRLCGEYRKTVHHLLSGSKKLVGTEYIK